MNPLSSVLLAVLSALFSTVLPALLPAIVATLALVQTAQADPMRPLAGAARPAAPAPNLATAATATDAAPAPAPAAPELVAIRQDSNGRRQALIGERWLAVGDRLGTASVAAIGSSAVDLVSAGRRETLRLLPPLVASSSGGGTAGGNAALTGQAAP